MSQTKENNQDLKKFYDTVAACNRCGFCVSYCPTYNVTGKESHSPRGRNQAFRALIEGAVANPKETKEIIDTCVLCGECTSICFSEVPTAFLMTQARNLYNQKYGLPRGIRFVLYKLLPNPTLFKWVLKMGFLGKRLGASWLLRKLGVLWKVAPALAVGDKNMKSAPLTFLKETATGKKHTEAALEKEQDKILAAQKNLFDLKAKNDPRSAEVEKEIGNISTRPPSVALFGACGTQYLRPSIGESTAKILEALGVRFLIPENLCCGLPGASYGDLDRVAFFAKQGIERFEKMGFETILIDDSSCGAHAKEWPQYLKDDPEWRQRSLDMASKIKSLPEFFIERGLLEKLRGSKWTEGKVAYHDPCKAQYGLKTTQPPRDLLNAIPGLELVRVNESDQCCGGGGTYNLVYPELAGPMGKSKVQNIADSGAQVVVTSSASCLLQLDTSLRKARLPIKPLHLTEIIAQALNL